MPTEKPRVTITVTKEQLEEIENYRYGNKIKNQTQAILSLVKAGLEEIQRSESEEIKTASESGKNDSEAVKKSNLEIFKDTLEKAGLLGKNQDISDNDLDFLKAMYLAIKAHFHDREKNGN